MENIDPRLRSTDTTKPLSLNDITDRLLHTRTLQVLLIVPTVDVQTASTALLSTRYIVEEACWLILEWQCEQGHSKLQLNGLIDLHTRTCVQKLQKAHPENSTQECYVAVRIARGNLDDATKHLEWMQAQKLEHAREGLAFLVAPDWTADVKPEW